MGWDLLQMTFVPALSREFRPYKPDPAPLLHICSAWNIPPHEVIMVGDSLKDDVSILHLIVNSSI
jgi:HAD superfamily hydrolase (TIGR01549 family)